MRLLLTLSALALLYVGDATAGAAAGRDTLTVKTSLGPLEEDAETDTRELRAEGRAPKGSRLVVTFYRGSKRIGRTRPKMRSGRRYSSDHEISRTGAYKVKVVATTREDERLTVTARLRYTPKAKAPSAPDDTEG